MIEKTIRIINSEGLHARTAAIFVQTAGKFTSSITVKKGDNEVNAKSIMGVMSMAIPKGEDITIIAKGEDEDKAVNELVLLLTNKEI
jgi:phosphocarrier protein